MDPTYPLFPIFSFLGGVLVLVPLPWHLQAWNAGTCYYMIWASIASLNQFVNSVIWAGNALNPAPIWCEISIRIIMGSSVGIPAASLCIVRRLYKIASVQSTTITPAEKRRAVLIDSLVCVLFPMIFIALQYVVQGHRFDIYEDIGCAPAEYNTILTYFIASIWPLILGLISAVYCILSIRAFNQRRLQFNQYLGSNKTLTVSRYFRLMALAMTEVSCTTPLSIFVIILNATTAPVDPWRGWADTHFAYSRVEQIPAVLWRNNHLVLVSRELTRWISPVCALVFFVFFGFAQEARKNYRIAFGRLGFSSLSSQWSPKAIVSHNKTLKPSNMESLGSLPIYVAPSATKQHRCFTSSSTQSESNSLPYKPSESVVSEPNDHLAPTSPPSSSTTSYLHEGNLELEHLPVYDDDRISISSTRYSTSDHELQVSGRPPPRPHLLSVVPGPISRPQNNSGCFVN